MLERGLKKLLAEANAVIDTVSVNEAAALVAGQESALVNVRETRERDSDGGISAWKEAGGAIG